MKFTNRASGTLPGTLVRREVFLVGGFDMRWFVLYVSALILLIGVGEGRASLIASRAYWTDTLTGTNNIQRANLDGTGIEVVVPSLEHPQAIALDLDGGKIYWTDDFSDKIQRANLDGSNVQDLVTDIKGPKGIALDIAGGKMYWADNFADKIQRANLDGSNIQDVFSYPSGGVGHGLGGVVLDLGLGDVYWADNATGVSGSIYRRQHGWNGGERTRVIIDKSRAGLDRLGPGYRRRVLVVSGHEHHLAK